MKYKKIRLSLYEYPEDLYRILYVDDEMTLLEFAFVIESTFRMMDEHTFYYALNGEEYCPKVWNQHRNVHDLEDTLWETLGDSFVFVYNDSGPYEIVVDVMGTEDLDDERRVILLEGERMGIWEDHFDLLSEYIENDELPDYCEDPDKYLPWNLVETEDIDDLYETERYDRECDQSRMNQLIAHELKLYMIEMNADYNSFFEDYNAIVERLRNMDDQGATYEKLCEEAMRTFIDECRQLKDSDLLPDSIGHLIQYGEQMVDLSYVLEVIPLFLISQKKYDKCIAYMKELEELFDDQLLHEITSGVLLDCYADQKKFAEAEAVIERMHFFSNDDLLCDAFRIRLYVKMGRYSDAEDLIELHIDDMDECTPFNWELFNAAVSLYRITDPKKAEFFERKLSMFNQFEDPDEPVGFSEASDELASAIERYKMRRTGERFSIAAVCFVMVAKEDGDIIVRVSSFADNDQMIPEIAEIDGQKYLSVYSGHIAAHHDHYYYDTTASLREAIEIAIANHLSGIIVDPENNDEGLIMNIHALEEIDRLIDENDAGVLQTPYLS